jgi:hypothetical protein
VGDGLQQGASDPGVERCDELDDVLLNHDGATVDRTVSSGGRCARMFGTLRGTQSGYSLWEFRIYGIAHKDLLKQALGQSSSPSACFFHH